MRTCLELSHDLHHDHSTISKSSVAGVRTSLSRHIIISPHHSMMKSGEEAIVKIPIMKYDGRQNLDLTAWKKSFATSMGCDLAQVCRTRAAFAYRESLRILPSAEMGKQMPWKEPCIWSAWQNIEKPRQHKTASTYSFTRSYTTSYTRIHAKSSSTTLYEEKSKRNKTPKAL